MNISKGNKKKVTLKEAEFIFSQAEKQLTQITDVSNKIVARTTTLISIVTILCTTLTGIAFSRYNTNSKDWQFVISVLMAIYFYLLILFLSRNFRGFVYLSSGSEPQDLLHNYYYDKTYQKVDDRMIKISIKEIISYQKRIQSGKTINDKRWKELHISMYLILFSPLLAAIICLFLICHCR